MSPVYTGLLVLTYLGKPGERPASGLSQHSRCVRIYLQRAPFDSVLGRPHAQAAGPRLMAPRPRHTGVVEQPVGISGQLDLERHVHNLRAQFMSCSRSSSVEALALTADGLFAPQREHGQGRAACGGHRLAAGRPLIDGRG